MISPHRYRLVFGVGSYFLGTMFQGFAQAENGLHYLIFHLLSAAFLCLACVSAAQWLEYVDFRHTNLAPQITLLLLFYFFYSVRIMQMGQGLLGMLVSSGVVIGSCLIKEQLGADIYLGLVFSCLQILVAVLSGSQGFTICGILGIYYCLGVKIFSKTKDLLNLLLALTVLGVLTMWGGLKLDQETEHVQKVVLGVLPSSLHVMLGSDSHLKVVELGLTDMLIKLALVPIRTLQLL